MKRERGHLAGGEYIGAFNVTMHHALVMQVSQALQYLTHRKI
jgi:hypothetical protein